MVKESAKSLKTSTKTVRSTPDEEPVLSKKSKLPQLKIKKLFLPLILVIIFFLLGSLLYKNKQLLIAGSINGKPIFTPQIYSRLMKQYGPQIFDQLIVEKLILDEAANKKISATDNEINDKISEIEKQFGSKSGLEDTLKQQGMTINDLKSQMTLQIIAAKLVSDKTSVTDEEVDKYIQDNKTTFPKDTDVNKEKDNIKNYLKDQKVREEIQKLITDLKAKAKITNFLK